ncbi:MAG: leucine-rich repeat domain-containing protein [Clostridia bacterium]|nr:leucine-rich repeat domain-containing protein [Clostridia bacterium]
MTEFIIENGILLKCESYESHITIPDGVTIIGPAAFEACENLRALHISKDVKKMDNGALYGPFRLESIICDKENGCFYVKDGFLINRVFSDFLPDKNILVYALPGPEEVVIPSYISGLAPYCFACSEICTVTFESDPASPYLLSVGKCAFLGCTALSSIIFPEKMSVIDDRAFEGCSSLWNVGMPRSLYKLGSYAFDGCSPKSLAIPEDLEMLGVNFVDTDTPLDLIYGSHGYELVENLDDVYNCRIFFHYLDSDFEISGKNLISCRSKQRHITLPDNIESIKANAFKNCANLESLYIPDSVMLIGDYALSGCQRLSEVRLPESYFGLGERVFENCPSLKKLHIPKSLLYFKRNAFEGSGPFESITCDEDSLRFVMKDGKLVTKGFSYRDHQGPDFELSMLFEDFTLGGEVILAEKGAEEETK